MTALAAAVATCFFAAPVFAQSCHDGPFAGPYVGATLGWARSDSSQYPRGEASLSGSDNSFLAGGHIGYGLQCGHVVLGAEADINWVDLVANTQQPDPAYYRSSIDWFGTVRGRLGLVLQDNMMLYATAGWAFADRTHHISAPTAPGGAFSQSDSDRANGYVVGGGIELFRNDRWLLRAEALWVDLDKESRDYVVSTTACNLICRSHVGWDDSFWTARLGLSIKLGGRAERHEPLK